MFKTIIRAFTVGIYILDSVQNNKCDPVVILIDVKLFEKATPAIGTTANGVIVHFTFTFYI